MAQRIPSDPVLELEGKVLRRRVSAPDERGGCGASVAHIAQLWRISSQLAPPQTPTSLSAKLPTFPLHLQQNRTNALPVPAGFTRTDEDLRSEWDFRGSLSSAAE